MAVTARRRASGQPNYSAGVHVPRHAGPPTQTDLRAEPQIDPTSSPAPTTSFRIPTQALAMDDFLVSTTKPEAGEGKPGSRGRRKQRQPEKPSRLRHLSRAFGAPTRFTITVLLAAVFAVVGTFFYGDRGTLAAEIAAAVISVNYAAAFARRIGGRAWAGALLGVLVAGAAVLTNQPVLLASAAVGTAVLAAVLGVIATRPAVTLVGIVREILIATGVALIGGLAATAYRAPLSAYRTRYLVIAIALVVTVALVYRFGAGLSGLGARGWASLGGGSIALVVIMVYTEAFTRWESDSLRTSIDDLLGYVGHTLGAVPRPLIFMVGLPALIWGVSSRVRRREGWWLTAFGSVGLAMISTMFLEAGHPTMGPVLNLAYSISLGMMLGGLLVLLDNWVSKPAGRRAAPPAGSMRPAVEPRRHEPLI